MVIRDSFPIPVCLPARNDKVRSFRDQVTVAYNPPKKMCFYGFKAHMLVTLSGFIVNYGCDASLCIGGSRLKGEPLKRDFQFYVLSLTLKGH